MAIIKILGVDPALANMGLVIAKYDTVDDKLEITDMKLIQTEKRSKKDVRVSSDDLRRAQELHTALDLYSKNMSIVFAEIPSGGQSARAVLGFGIAIGVVASCRIPVIEVSPREAKEAAVGTSTASKQEMIEWATSEFPDAEWIKRKFKGKMRFTSKNEHLADACAIIVAGTQTPQFKQLIQLMNTAAQ